MNDEKHVHPCPHCDAALDVTQFQPFDKIICPHCNEEARIKTDFGNYRLTQRLAAGGMSVVFTAHDLTLDRKVALKLLNKQYSENKTRAEQFENEARLTAAVSHPNVVRLFTVGQDHNRFYIAMELIEGQSLEKIIDDKGALRESLILDIGIQICKGLQAAHKVGVLHRDMKPGNILIDKKENAHIIDFGLALLAEKGQVTADEIWATPYYTPPEALENKSEDLRSDLYALAASLYHALTGKPPFESTSTSPKVLRHAKQKIPRLKKAAPWLHSVTCETIDRMMAYDIEHRTDSYTKVIKSLQKCRETLKTDGENPPPHPRSPHLRRPKKPLLLRALPLLALALIGALSYAFFQYRLKETDPTPTPHPITHTTPPNTPDKAPSKITHDPLIAEETQQARALLARGEYNLAKERFLELAQKKQHDATIEAILCALLDGRTQNARKIAAQAEETLPSQLNDLRDICEILAHWKPIPHQQFPDPNNNSLSLLASLAGNLKNWEQGLIPTTLPWLQKFAQHPLPPELAELSTYQTLIRNHYLPDAQALAEFNWENTPHTPEEAQKQIQQLNLIYPRLKTRGRAKYNIRTRQLWLHRQARQLQKTNP